MIDPPEVLVFGPYMRNSEGKPGTVIPRWAWAPRPGVAQLDAAGAETCIGAMNSEARKPVLQMMQSSSRSRPSAVRMPRVGDLGDRVGDQLDVRAGQRRQVVRAEQDPLAAERVVGPHLGPQLGIGQLAAHEQRRAQRADPPHRARMADGQRQRLAVVEQVPAPQPVDRRKRAGSARGQPGG